ncbi:MAG: preprotein translocase subunit YajC [Syntrophales bacterium]
MIDQAFAMGNLGGGGTAPGGDISFFVMLGVLFAIFYFLIFRPQQKKQKEITDMLANLHHGDMVVTSGGIHGKITALTDNVVTLEVADKVRIKVSRNAITSITQKAS